MSLDKDYDKKAISRDMSAIIICSLFETNWWKNKFFIMRKSNCWSVLFDSTSMVPRQNQKSCIQWPKWWWPWWPKVKVKCSKSWNIAISLVFVLQTSYLVLISHKYKNSIHLNTCIDIICISNLPRMFRKLQRIK